VNNLLSSSEQVEPAKLFATHSPEFNRLLTELFTSEGEGLHTFLWAWWRTGKSNPVGPSERSYRDMLAAHDDALSQLCAEAFSAGMAGVSWCAQLGLWRAAQIEHRFNIEEIRPRRVRRPTYHTPANSHLDTPKRRVCHAQPKLRQRTSSQQKHAESKTQAGGLPIRLAGTSRAVRRVITQRCESSRAKPNQPRWPGRRKVQAAEPQHRKGGKETAQSSFPVCHK
jgi:hypothetical protein